MWKGSGIQFLQLPPYYLSDFERIKVNMRQYVTRTRDVLSEPARDKRLDLVYHPEGNRPCDFIACGVENAYFTHKTSTPIMAQTPIRYD